ncbi:hypothetical protein AaE_015130 [Aphanomyces astaci]|uniref:Uncharacterized protein n=1 Tax=Aphanomyces astaci TaxID=112090 RepID=A0A6A4Z9V5_APHAT|nr:hypothetical protein AaE_015130 [Aphanomyces astaci]
MHKESNVRVSDELETLLADFACGYKRKVAQLKDSGDMAIGEGKRQMTFDGYCFLVAKALGSEAKHNLSTMVHPFLLLCWNLIARSASVAAIRYDHLAWEGDALVVQYAFTKSDQVGKNCTPRHIFANPGNPAICPILSLAVLIFTRGAQRGRSANLVFGENAGERFSAWLSKTLKDIGTHSFRKGVASELSNTPGGPEAVNVWLRAGWTLGSVQGRYIFAGSGGDQFVGRAAAGHNVNDVEFSCLPPHFKDVGLSNEQWEAALPGYSTFYPSSFRQITPFLVASLSHHYIWLQHNLGKHHPLFLAPVWTSGLLPKLNVNVEMGRMHNSTTNLRSSGIPPFVAITNRLATVENELKIVNEQINYLPCKISDQLRASKDSSATTTHLESFRDSVLSEIRTLIGASKSPEPPASVNGVVTEPWWTTTNPQEQRRPSLPPGKVFDLWNAWWYGLPGDGIVPLRLVRPQDLARRCDRVNYSKLKQVIASLMKFSTVPETEVQRMAVVDRSALFASCLERLGHSMLVVGMENDVSNRRLDEMTYPTMYDLIKKYKL